MGSELFLQWSSRNTSCSSPQRAMPLTPTLITTQAPCCLNFSAGPCQTLPALHNPLVAICQPDSVAGFPQDPWVTFVSCFLVPRVAQSQTIGFLSKMVPTYGFPIFGEWQNGFLLQCWPVTLNPHTECKACENCGLLLLVEFPVFCHHGLPGLPCGWFWFSLPFRGGGSGTTGCLLLFSA